MPKRASTIALLPLYCFTASVLGLPVDVHSPQQPPGNHAKGSILWAAVLALMVGQLGEDNKRHHSRSLVSKTCVEMALKAL